MKVIFLSLALIFAGAVPTVAQGGQSISLAAAIPALLRCLATLYKIESLHIFGSSILYDEFYF